MKSVKYILQISAALSFIELVFNAPVLLTSHDSSINWNMPVVAFENDEGVGCVVDNYWNRMTVLNPDKTVRSVISAEYASSVAPDVFSEMALDDRYIYLLDKVKSCGFGTTLRQAPSAVCSSVTIRTILSHPYHCRTMDRP